MISRLLLLLLALPCALREWIDISGDLLGHASMTKTIHAVLTKTPIASRVIESMTAASVGAYLITIMHVALGLVLSVGWIFSLSSLKKDSNQFTCHSKLLEIGLALSIFLYIVIFQLIAMGYFESQTVGMNFMLPVTSYLIPSAIALIYLRFLAQAEK